jgi:phosphatidylglycerol:prolipoprotein diacylglycerol transferase
MEAVHLASAAGRGLTFHGFRRSVGTSPLLTLMNFPVYIPIGSLKIHPHLAFETAAYAIAFRIYLTLRKRAGDALDDGNRWWIIAAAAMGAMVGSKLLYWCEDPALTLAHWREPAYLMSGKTIVGALIGGLFAVELAKQILGIKRRTGDLFAVPLCVGIAIGRIGCFLTGLEDHTAGAATSLPWGVNFGDGIPRHPTQLYEVLFALALGGYLWRRMYRPFVPGVIFKMFIVAYFTFRLTCDFLKPDVRVFLGLSSIQLACVAMLLYYSPDWLRWLNPRGRSAPATADPTTSQSVAADQTGGGIG